MNPQPSSGRALTIEREAARRAPQNSILALDTNRNYREGFISGAQFADSNPAPRLSDADVERLREIEAAIGDAYRPDYRWLIATVERLAGLK